MPSQANHIYFVYFGHDVKILKIECLGLGLCLVVKSYTILFLSVCSLFVVFSSRGAGADLGKLHQIHGFLD